jgi:hypothetical protein
MLTQAQAAEMVNADVEFGKIGRLVIRSCIRTNA